MTLFDAWELPRPQPGQGLRADEDELLHLAVPALEGFGRDETALLGSARQLGDSLERTVVLLYRRHFEHYVLDVTVLRAEAGYTQLTEELVDRIPEVGLPRARVGLHTGPVVFQNGDYFGRTVNIAARISDYARPGEVLVSEDVVAVDTSDAVRYEPVGPSPSRAQRADHALHRGSRRVTLSACLRSR